MNETKDMDLDKDNDPENMWSFGISPSRVETLCDSTFAIAMTILVLELSMDEKIIDALAMHGDYDSHHLFIGLYTYIMGFVVLGIYWALHHYIFHFIRRSNGVLVWLNVLFLIFAALVPLSTKVNQTHSESYAGYLFFALTTVITLLLLLVIWIYSTRGFRLVDRDINKKNISIIINIIIIGSSTFMIFVILTYFISWIGYLGFVSMAYVIISIATGNDKPWRMIQVTGS